MGFDNPSEILQTATWYVGKGASSYTNPIQLKLYDPSENLHNIAFEFTAQLEPDQQNLMIKEIDVEMPLTHTKNHSTSKAISLTYRLIESLPMKNEIISDILSIYELELT